MFVNMMEFHWVLVGAVDGLKRRKGEYNQGLSLLLNDVHIYGWVTADDVVRCRGHPGNIGQKIKSSSLFW